MATVTLKLRGIDIEAEVEYANIQVDSIPIQDPITGNMEMPVYSNIPVSIHQIEIKSQHSLSSAFLVAFREEIKHHIKTSPEILRQLNAYPVPK